MRSYRRVVAPVVRLLHHLPVWALGVLFLLASATGFAAGAVSLWLLSGGPRPDMGVICSSPGPRPPSWPSRRWSG